MVVPSDRDKHRDMNTESRTPGAAPASPRILAADLAVLTREIDTLHVTGERFILGLCGAPGAGKSTVAAELAQQLGDGAVVVPLDGFHLAARLIRGTPLAVRRGAPDTFDVAGYAALMTRLRAADEDVVFAPAYRREIEDPIAASIAVPRHTPIVITEGNYLLLPEGYWSTARRVMDSVWYLELDDAVRLERLVRRHIEFGKAPQTAADWAHGTDERNAQLIRNTRRHADRIVMRAIGPAAPRAPSAPSHPPARTVQKPRKADPSC